MKTLYLVIGFCFTMTTVCFAHLFASADDCDARYGKPLSVETLQQPLAQQRTYSKDGFTIVVRFSKEGTFFTQYTAQMLIFTKENGGDLTDKEIEILLGTEAGTSDWNDPKPMMKKHFWSAETGKVWERKDGQALAAHLIEGKSFTVVSKHTWEVLEESGGLGDL